MMTTFDVTELRHRSLTRSLSLLVFLWALAVAVAAETGVLARLWMPAIAGLVALGIALPTLWYFVTPAARAWADRLGLRAITAFHAWRVPAALLFFWYGLQGELPTTFWLLAGAGDLIAGLWAIAVTARKDSSHSAYARMHIFGFADFAVAVGTGLTFTLLLDPRMAAITTLPLALIPLFGVGLSGTTHLVAFDMLRRARK
jgi:hypothetical protein